MLYTSDMTLMQQKCGVIVSVQLYHKGGACGLWQLVEHDNYVQQGGGGVADQPPRHAYPSKSPKNTKAGPEHGQINQEC